MGTINVDKLHFKHLLQLIKTSYKYIVKRVSTKLIRHIVSYHRNGGKEGKQKKQEQIELAEAMGHSVGIQDKIYNKA